MGAHENYARGSVSTSARKIDLRPGNGPEIPARPSEAKSGPQGSDFFEEFEPENLSQKTKLHFKRVNEVTFKLTDGEVTHVPASHGQWGGYRATKAVAWVINLAPGQWLARCRDKSSGPTSFHEAKANALAMARGAHGDYFIENPIDHLNGLQARLLDREGEAE